jgi:hypothetical protein
MTEFRHVIRAYKAESRTDNGMVTEEVLLLDDGHAVYCNPGYEDAIVASLDDALAYCVAEPYESATLLAAWQRAGGYPV